MSGFSSSSIEYYCLGGLIKDIDIVPSLRDFELDSKDQTSYKTIDGHKLSLDSIYSFTRNKALLSTNIEKNKQNDTLSIFSINSILSALNNRKSSIILQKSLMEAPKEVLNNIIKEMSGYFSSIIKDKNGNYFCTDLFKVCDKNQRIKILNEICNTITEDCIDEYGSHPIQTLIELASCEEEYKLLLMSFNDSNKILKAAFNENGTYVIQKLVVHIPEKFRKDFNLTFVKYIYILAMDKYGVCTVIKFFKYTKNEIIEKHILNLILSNFVNISENQYGNYLVQNILEQWWNSNKGLYLKKICIDKFHILAAKNFSSYVCDMFLKLSDIEDKKVLMSNLISFKNVHLFNCNNISKIIINKLKKDLKYSSSNNNNNTKKVNKEKKSL